MKILFAASEIAPFLKTGGLGDVMGALPLELLNKGEDVRCVMPLYGDIATKYRDQMELVSQIEVPLSWRNLHAKIYQYNDRGVIVYFIENDYFFHRPNIYGEKDDAERFAFFSKAVIEMFHSISFYPEILHCNDWQTALIPVYLNVFYKKAPEYRSIKTVYTIHNIAYQGIFGRQIIWDVFGFNYAEEEVVIYNNDVNLMKAAIVCSDWVTTVSNTYSEEIKTPYYAYGLEHILNEHAYKLSGIVNGIDVQLFNSLTDQALFMNYGIDSLPNKQINKTELQKLFHLPIDSNKPVIGIISRLASIKGLNLIERILDDLTKLDCQFVLLGKGDTYYEELFKDIAKRYPHQFGVSISFSNELASRIYAGSDLFLMPSQSEPCGLAQMIALSYGTIPIVRATGGLKDTVIPWNEENQTGFGFVFERYNEFELLDCIKDSLSIYHQPNTFKQMMINGMKQDFSWRKSSAEYLKLYQNVRKRK